MLNILPPSVELLKIAGEELQSLAPVFIPETPDFNNLLAIASDKNPLSHDLFLQSPLLIKYLQILTLIALSMDDSFLKLPISRVVKTQNEIKLTWKNGSASKFTLEVFDENFEKYLSIFQRQILKSKTKILENLQKLLIKHIAQLDASKNRFLGIITKEEDMTLLFQNEIETPSLFLLLSCLPQTQLSALFVYIQQFFPDELEIKGPNGNKIQITSFFQSNNTDLNYMLDKIKVYLELYYSSNKPIIRHITQDKTKSFMQEIFQNKDTKNQTFENLKSALDTQILPRLLLYSVFSNHLNAILTK